MASDDDGKSKTEYNDHDVIPLEVDVSLSMPYLGTILILSLSFVMLYESDSIIIGCMVPILGLTVFALFLADKLGPGVLKGMKLPLSFAVPLSIISYFNEYKNGCFSFFDSGCSYPSYYALPKAFGAAFGIGFLLYGLNKQTEGQKSYGFGIFIGTLISTLIFLMATIYGWSSD